MSNMPIKLVCTCTCTSPSPSHSHSYSHSHSHSHSYSHSHSHSYSHSPSHSHSHSYSHSQKIKSYLRETQSKNHETLEPLSNSSIAQVLKNIENNYLKFWQGEITASKKLDFYRKFKQDFSVNSYIDILRNRGTRKSFVKFYLSNHKLCIESGRHRRPVLPREERICAVCKNNEIEDEAHMLFSCTLYSTLREQFLIKQQLILNTAFDNYDYWLNILFTTENKASIRTTARYISQCFLLRDAASSN